MCVHDLADDVETETQALTCRLVVVDAVKPLENAGQDLRGDPWSMIANLDLGHVVYLAQCDLDRTAAPGEGDGVANEVEEDLLEAAGVAQDQNGFVIPLEMDRLFGGDRLQRIERATSKVDDVER